MYLDDIWVKAEQKEDGTVVHHSPPEYHGDPLRPAGALAFYHFGWKLLDEIRQVGFRRVEIGLAYDPFAGFIANNHPDYEYAVMLPVVFRAVR